MRAQQQHVSAAILASEPAIDESIATVGGRDRSQSALRLPGTLTAERPALASLAGPLEQLIDCLESSGEASLRAAVGRCTEAVEDCLEMYRQREPPPGNAQDELRWLVRHLRAGADPTSALRRIRRVLGRIDAEAEVV